jgi:hypothetical protein
MWKWPVSKTKRNTHDRMLQYERNYIKHTAAQRAIHISISLCCSLSGERNILAAGRPDLYNAYSWRMADTGLASLPPKSRWQVTWSTEQLSSWRPEYEVT